MKDAYLGPGELSRSSEQFPWHSPRSAPLPSGGLCHWKLLDAVVIHQFGISQHQRPPPTHCNPLRRTLETPSCPRAAWGTPLFKALASPAHATAPALAGSAFDTLGAGNRTTLTATNLLRFHLGKMPCRSPSCSHQYLGHKPASPSPSFPNLAQNTERFARTTPGLQNDPSSHTALPF